MLPVKGAAAIVGIGQTEFSKNSGRSELQLCAEAVRAAIVDAGLQPADVDGAVTFTIDPNDELNLMRSVGITRDAMDLADPVRRRWIIGHHRACHRGGGVGGGRCRGRVPRLQRAVRPALRPAHGRPPPPGHEFVPAVRARHPGQGVLALVPAVHASLRGHQRGLRPLLGGGSATSRRPTRTPGTTSVRSRWRTIRPRAGSSNRSCACSTAARRATGVWRWWSRGGQGQGPPSAPGDDPGRHPGHTSSARRSSTTTTTTSPGSPRPSTRPGSSGRRPASGPRTSMWR